MDDKKADSCVSTSTCSSTALVKELRSSLSPMNLDALLDIMVALYNDCNNPLLRKLKTVDEFIKKFDPFVLLINEHRLKTSDFNIIKVIGRGAFGEVKLVRYLKNGKVYAMKMLNKDDMIRRSDTALFWAERDIMARSASPWIVSLQYAFQDPRHLYMIMEYMPGGDLVNLILNYEVCERWARFYVAELVEALSALHQLGFIHRDVKPDNLLVSASGHIKLADFGTCLKINHNGRVVCSTAVGTPDYIAPEVLANQGKETDFGPEIDWWSCGIVLYELFVGETPFYADSIVNTYTNIMNFKKSLNFPEDCNMSPEAKDLIVRFLTDATSRLGRTDALEIKMHAFFKNDEWNFESLRSAQPPIVPELNGDDDTSNFSEVQPEKDPAKENFQIARTFTGNQLPFVGFTYTNELSFSTYFERYIIAERKVPSPVKEIKYEEALHAQSEIAKYKEKIEELEKRERLLVERYEKRSQESDAQSAQLLKRIRELELGNEESRLAQRKNMDNVEALRRVESEFEAQRNALRELENQLKVALENESSTQRKLCQAIEDLEAERQEITRKNSRIEELEKKNNVHALRLQEVENSKSELLKTLAKLNDEKENGEGSRTHKITNREEEYKRIIEKSRQQLDEAQLELQHEISRQSAFCTEIEAQAKIISSLRHSENAQREENRRLTDEKNQLQILVERLSTEKNQMDNKIKEIMHFARNDQDIIAAIKKDNDLLHLEIHELNSKLTRAAEQKEDADELKCQFQSEKLARKIAEQNLADVEKQRLMLNEELKKLVQRFEKEETASANAIKVLTDQLEEMRVRVTALPDDFECVDAEQKHLVERINSLQAENHDLAKKLEMAESLKKSAISKLEQVAYMRQPEKSGSSVHKLRIKERELMNAQQQLCELKRSLKDAQEEREKLIEMASSLQHRCEELEFRVVESEERPSSASCSLIGRSRSFLLHAEILEGVLFLRPEAKKGSRIKPSKMPWLSMLGKLTPTNFCLFAELKKGFGYEDNPTYFIDAVRLCHARSVTAADVRFAEASALPKIFHIMYDATDSQFSSRHSSVTDLSAQANAELSEDYLQNSLSALTPKHRHEFQELSFHMTAYCDFCKKKLSDLIRPPPALECKSCRYKMHREHNLLDVPVCKSRNGVLKELLLMAKDETEAKRWVRALLTIIQDAADQKRGGSFRNLTMSGTRGM